MNVHLLKSTELYEPTYRDALNLLKGIPGILNFVESEDETNEDTEESDHKTKIIKDEAEFIKKHEVAFDQPSLSVDHFEFPMKRKEATWSQLFNKCRIYRKQNDIGESEAVVLLTDISNDKNWFSAGEPGHLNFFIHTEDWDFFLGRSVDRRYPIAYQVAAILLQYYMFDNYKDVSEHVHFEPRGCIMDFCRSKKEVVLKMRTADVCDTCLSRITSRNIDRRIVKHCFEILDGVREAMMFRTRSLALNQPSRMAIKGHLNKIYLTDFGNLEVRLNPKERSLYLLFLNHPEGIQLHDMPDHREELLTYYGRLSTSDDNQIIVEAVNRLTDPLDDNLNTVLSRIKRKFREAVGDQLSEHYIISGERGEAKAISIDRTLVQFHSLSDR